MKDSYRHDLLGGPSLPPALGPEISSLW